MKRRKRSASCERPFALVRPAAAFQSGFSTLRPSLVRFTPSSAAPDRVGLENARARRNAGRATDRVRRSRVFRRRGPCPGPLTAMQTCGPGPAPDNRTVPRPSLHSHAAARLRRRRLHRCHRPRQRVGRGRVADRTAPRRAERPAQPSATPARVVIALKSRTAPVAEAVRTRSPRRAGSRAGARHALLQGPARRSTRPRRATSARSPTRCSRLRGARGAVVCPAFPTNGRTVYRGHLFVGDLLLSDSPMRASPADPDDRRQPGACDGQPDAR